MPIDATTRRWIRNASDERAACDGCWFDESVGQWVVDWIEKHCHLYEGEYAGQHIELRGGDDWQYEAVMRLFGWRRESKRWGRTIRRFRRGSVWVPKKNKKSPTLAAIGLYLLIGDGEQGQKIFSCAKDGKQALIAHEHAMQMVRMSPELMDECKINKSTGRIVHKSSKSFYTVVAGDNLNSQEGLNGSLLVDETHVVDRRLMAILRRAGISRSEPLQLEFSTAGKDPDGYGKEQWDYGLQVESGDITDPEFFFMSYHAPQDLSDDVLDRDLVKLGKKCNPAWGHTIDEAEYEADYKRSKLSMSALSAFKMYRLNVWQRSTNPFIKSGDWAQCAAPFTEDDLAGETCCAGLDLSKTRDMTSLVLAFPNEELGTISLLPYFWMPENEAKRKAHLAGFMEWARAGHLILTPGDVLDYGYVKSKFRELAEKFNITELAYDLTYAEELTQALEQGVMDASGKVVEEGTGVTRFIFKQTIMGFAAPTAEFERLIIAGNLRHNNHRVLNWQAGHVQVWTDCNQNMRPIKPKKDDVKKIDGIVAAIMAVGRSMESEDDPMAHYQNAGVTYV